MEYSVIFTTGYTDDIESLTKQLKGDVLLLDEKGNYYNPQFITLNRIRGEFDNHRVCYLEDNLVIMHEITKDNILNSVSELHKWLFYKRWIPISTEQLEKYFYPKDSWAYFLVAVD